MLLILRRHNKWCIQAKSSLLRPRVTSYSRIVVQPCLVLRAVSIKYDGQSQANPEAKNFYNTLKQMKQMYQFCYIRVKNNKHNYNMRRS